MIKKNPFSVLCQLLVKNLQRKIKMLVAESLSLSAVLWR